MIIIDYEAIRQQIRAVIDDDRIHVDVAFDVPTDSLKVVLSPMVLGEWKFDPPVREKNVTLLFELTGGDLVLTDRMRYRIRDWVDWILVEEAKPDEVDVNASESFCDGWLKE